jgi:putative aldouronate transport system permease protein
MESVKINRTSLHKVGERLWNGRYCYLMLLPVMANFIVFHYWPMFGLQIAFKSYNAALGIAGSPWIGFENFTKFFTGMYFWPLLRNTLVISLECIGFGFPAPILLALLLNEAKNQTYKRFVQTVSYMPYFLSAVVIVSLLNLFFSSGGLFNGLITSFGGKPILFLQSPQYFRTLFVGSLIWQWTGFDAIIYLAAITAIDLELYEAAELDGAGRFAKIWHITLAGIAPTIIILFILRMGGILNISWLQALLMQNSLNSSVSDVIQTYVYKRGLVYRDYSFGAAVGMFQSIVSLIFVVGSNMISKRLSAVSIF